MDDFISYRGVEIAAHVLATLAGLAACVCYFVLDRSGRSTKTPAADDTVHEEPRALRMLGGLATLALLSGWAAATMRTSHGAPIRVPPMTLLMAAVSLWTIQWFHAAFVTWPGLKFGGERGRRRAAAGLRANAMMSIPALLLFVAAELAPELGGGGRWIPHGFWIANFGVYALIVLGPVVAPRHFLRVTSHPILALLLGFATLGSLTLM